MEIRTLRAFVEVVRRGGFSQAAKTVFATQSTVSKAVKQLEDEIGFPLLDRIGHRSKLTSAGEVVYRRALRLLAERDDLMAEIEELRGLKRGILRLGLPAMASNILFAPLFAAYRRRYPSVEIHLVEHGAVRLEELLLAGEIELGASLLPVPEGFDTQDVRREPLVALLPEKQPLSRKKSLGLVDLRHLPFILFETDFAITRIILDACRQHGFEPTIAVRGSQIDLVTELVAAGMGVAFLPRMIAAQCSHPRVRRVLLAEPNTEWHMAIIWRRGSYLSHAANAWLQLAREIHKNA
jgi:DNA-binding transcriptional LysR family regulator